MSLYTRIKSILLRLFNKQMNAIEYASTLKDLSVYIEKDVHEITITTLIELWESIIGSTPVDLGVAQGEWQIEENYNSTILNQDVLDKKALGEYNMYTGQVVPVPDTPSYSKFKSAKHISIFNNAPYIEDLENGTHPGHIKGAMISDNIDKYQRIFEDRLKKTGLFK